MENEPNYAVITGVATIEPPPQLDCGFLSPDPLLSLPLSCRNRVVRVGVATPRYMRVTAVKKGKES